MINLMFGDCLQLMTEIESNSVDMILCDLPYGTTQCKWDTVINFEKLWGQYKRIAKPNAAIVLTAMQPFTSALIMSNPAMFRYEWIWEKSSATGFLNAKKQPLRAHESAIVFYESQPIYNPQMTHGHARKTAKRKTINSEVYGKAFQLTEYDSTYRYPRSVQLFKSDKQNSSLWPTQKPLDLMKYFINTYTNPGAVVMDNCMGSGTTGKACQETGRHFLGMESDERAFSIATNRLLIENRGISCI